jgi:hypothetical protein
VAAPRWMRETGWLVGGTVVAFLLAAFALGIFTRTDWGRERVLAFTLKRLGAGINGELVVKRLEGNLLTGAKLHGVVLRSRDGDPFLLADSAYVNYDPRTLTTPRIHLDLLVLYDPEVYVRRLPGDTLWNYQKIFADTTERPERITLADRVRVVNGFVRVQLPWEPDRGLSPRERQREIREVLSDSSDLMVKRVPGGILQTVELSRLYGELSRVRFAPGTEVGTYVAVDTLAGRVQYFRTPFQVRGLEGEVTVLPDRVEYRAPRAVVNTTPLSTYGVIRPPETREELTKYDILFRSDSVALRDFRWLYPRFPKDATGRLSLLIETRPEGTLFLARDMRLRAPGTRLTGSFGMITGDTLRFVDVDLRASPLRVATIEEMLPEGMPVRGLRIGEAEIRGTPARPRS